MFSQAFDETGPFSLPPRRGASPFGRGFGDPFRAGRGMMEPAILGALADHPMHGYEIINYLEEKSHGVWRPSPGSIYPTLQLLEEKGLVENTAEAGKKTYRLTDDGEDAARDGEQQRAHWREPFSDRFNKAIDQRKTLAETMRLMRTIYRRGDDAQTDELGRAIEAFRSRLAEIARKDDKS